MSLFHHEEIEIYLSELQAVTAFKQDKTLYNYYPVDSNEERSFALECEAEESIRFFFKLPRGFKISTPIGSYNPDWAIVLENDQRIYFVTETKSTLEKQDRRVAENRKIACGAKHFDAFAPSVEYRVAVTTRDFLPF
jgi:type III restriction enzyme